MNRGVCVSPEAGHGGFGGMPAPEPEWDQDGVGGGGFPRPPPAPSPRGRGRRGVLGAPALIRARPGEGGGGGLGWWGVRSPCPPRRRALPGRRRDGAGGGRGPAPAAAGAGGQRRALLRRGRLHHAEIGAGRGAAELPLGLRQGRGGRPRPPGGAGKGRGGGGGHWGTDPGGRVGFTCPGVLGGGLVGCLPVLEMLFASAATLSAQPKIKLVAGPLRAPKPPNLNPEYPMGRFLHPFADPCYPGPHGNLVPGHGPAGSPWSGEG